MTTNRSAGLLFAALLIAAIVAIYWPGRNGGFVFDDMPNIVENTALHVTSLARAEWLAAVFSSPASAFQRPVAMLTFATNHYFTGLDPMPMKLVNIGIHAANALLVLLLVRRLLTTAAPDVSSGRRTWAARFVAAAWALHPLQLMAVLYVVQRMESLSHLFVFAGLLAYVAGRQRQLEGRGVGRWCWVGSSEAPASASLRKNRRPCCRCTPSSSNCVCSASRGVRPGTLAG